VQGVKDYAIFMLDPQGRISTWNEGAERIKGWRAEEIVGRHFSLFYPAEEAAAGLPDHQLRAAVERGSFEQEGVRVRKDGSAFVAQVTITALHDAHGRVRGFTKITRDITERRRAEEELRRRDLALESSERRLRLALESGGMGTWEWNHAEATLWWDSAQYVLWGVTDGTLIAPEILDAYVHPDDRRGLKAKLEASAEAGGEFAAEFRVLGPDGRVRWLASKGASVGGPGGRSSTMIGVSFDVTERRSAEEQRQLLTSELGHRMKNMMTLVNSIVTLSSKDSASVEHYQRSLKGRLSAITETSRRLVESEWQGADLIEVLQAELEPYRNTEESNLWMSGPAVPLSAHATLQLALAFHELATNAAKYGSLSVPVGRLHIEWHINARALNLDWRETGGPEVHAPSRRGFGTTVVERTIVQSLGGSWRVEYAPSGLHGRMELPLDELTPETAPASS
jgi:PAS domain S-box-containing protein